MLLLSICWCCARISPHAMLRKWHLLPFALSIPSGLEHKDKSETEFKQMTKLIPSDIHSCSFFILNAKNVRSFFVTCSKTSVNTWTSRQATFIINTFCCEIIICIAKNILNGGLGSLGHGMYTEWEAWEGFDWRSNTPIHHTLRVNYHALIP